MQKHYVHVGMAVDTPRGLVVPVIRDVNEKGIWDISAEIAEPLAMRSSASSLAATCEAMPRPYRGLEAIVFGVKRSITIRAPLFVVAGDVRVAKYSLVRRYLFCRISTHTPPSGSNSLSSSTSPSSSSRRPSQNHWAASG